MKFNLGIDVDCTLNRFHIDLSSYVASNPELRHLAFSELEYITTQIQDLWKMDTRSVINIIQSFMDSPAYLQTEPIDGSVKAIETLRKKYRLYAITSRHAEAKTPTINWLLKHFGDSFKEVICTDGNPFHSKSEVCEARNIDLMVDDSYNIINQLVEKRIPIIFFSGAYSEENVQEILKRISKPVPRARIWPEAVDMIRLFK